MQHEHLPVGGGSSPDPDRRDAQRVRDRARQLAGHALEHDAERTGLLQPLRIGQDARRLGVSLALDLEAAHLVDELRRQADVTHDRDADLGEPARDFDHPASAFELDRVHAGLLHEAAGARDRLLDRRVIGHERHVADQQRLLGAPSDGLRVVQHVVQRHRQRRRVAEHHHAEAVADQQDGDSRLVEDLRAQVVVGREHGKAPALVLQSLDVQHRGHRRPLLRVAATSRVSALLVRPAAAGSSPASSAISSATRASIR